jgi:hypothetical protein
MAEATALKLKKKKKGSPNTQTLQTHRNMVFGAGHSGISNTPSIPDY